MTSPVRVAVNGYGVIGKRVADAVRLQDDMILAGVADVITDYRVHTAIELNIPLYAATEDARTRMRQAGLPVAGSLDDLIAASDIVVDATPKTVAGQNRERGEIRVDVMLHDRSSMGRRGSRPAQADGSWDPQPVLVRH